MDNLILDHEGNPATHHRATVNGVRLHYVTAGQGPALLLVHGVPKTSFYWNRVFPLLSRHFTLVAPDVRGFGDSDKPKDGYDMETVAADLSELMTQLGHEKFYLHGEDWGAAFSYAVAALNRDRVLKFSFAEKLLPGFGLEQWSHLTAENVQNRHWLWHVSFFHVPDVPEYLIQGKEREFWSNWMKAECYDPHAISETAVDEFVRCCTGPGGLRPIFEVYRQTFKNQAFTKKQAERKLEMPLLVIGAEHFTGDYGERQARLFASDVTGELYDCGHKSRAREARTSGRQPAPVPFLTLPIDSTREDKMNRRYFLQVSASAMIACAAAGQLLAAETNVQKMLDELATGKVQSLGPHGEAPQPADGVRLSYEELSKIKAMNATAAIVLHYRNDWAVAQIAGLTDQFNKMGIKIISVTDANFKPEKQVADIETVLALKPSIIVSIPVDPVATASAYKKAADAGVKIVFMDNVPQGMKIGKDYVSAVSSDNYGNGVASALLMAKAVEEEGEIGIVYLAGDFFVTKQRYDAFKKTVTDNFPQMKIVAEQGIDGTDLIGNAEKAASAILAAHPNIKAIWAVWEAPADGVMSAARTAGRKDLIITTVDLGLNACLSLAKGTFVKGIGAQRPYQQGVTEAILAGYGLLGKKAPDYVVLPPLAVTRDNLLESWKLTYHSEAPASLVDALN